MTGSYSIKILMALENNQLTLYKLSKILGSQGKRVSSGSLIPALKKLEKTGYIESSIKNRYKEYRLTDKGKTYLNSISDMRDKLRRDLLESLTKQDILNERSNDIHDLILNEELFLDIKNFIDTYGINLNYIITKSFILFRKGDHERIENFFKNAREVLG